MMNENMSAKNLPRISIVTPSYNQGNFIEDTICSVLEQGYPNLEYIVMDGGSTDQSVEVIKKYAKYLTYWISERDRGQTDAINRGFRIATGDVLGYLNSDDFLLPNALNIIAQAYSTYPSAGLYMGTGISVDVNKRNPKRYSKTVGFDYEALLKGSCYVLQPATFINRIAYEKVGELDESLKYGMDLEYWLRIGRNFDVVVIDEPLAAYRMYDDIKTISGGFERWVELWNIYRRYTDLQITPGLLVEFFSILRHPAILKQLGMDIRELAELGFQKTYSLMQTTLGLDDCIPTGKGIIFKPTVKEKSEPLPSTKAPIEKNQHRQRGRSQKKLISSRFSQPKIDIVLQATGVHAWGVGGGWANAASMLGMLHRVFAPSSHWGDRQPEYDDGLFDYLANPQAEIILLLGFDWHSQMLHLTPRWKERWRESKIYKVLYVQESIENSVRLSGCDDMKRALLSAIECVNAIVYTDFNDRRLMESTGKPAIWQPFGVDATIFTNQIPFRERIARPFFRGKSTAFAGMSQTYQQRRELIQYLLGLDLLDLLEYSEHPVTPHEIADDFNRYQIAVNFPSVFSNHPSRVTEALACRCALVTNCTGIPEVDKLFEDRTHLCYYRNKEELAEAIRMLIRDTSFAERVAAEGYQHCMDCFTLDKHLLQIISWINTKGFIEPSVKGDEINKRVTIEHRSKQQRKILIDGVIFYLQQKRPLGISRVWKTLLTELGKSSLAKDILLLDRASTAPEISGIQKRVIEGYNHLEFEDDPLYLQRICDEESASLLISTYHTYAENTHTAIMLHDMIPEVCGQDLSLPDWRAKTKAIEKACAYFAVSLSTMNDFRKLYPQYENKPVYLTLNAVSDAFHTHTLVEIADFKQKYHISKPYFLLVGHRNQYKNAHLFFRALSLMSDKEKYAVVCTGGAPELENTFIPYVRGIEHHLLFLTDEELSTAFSGAIALVYPSRYEGFGLPILEAMASGCPVITCPNSSIPEVAGEAAIYVGETDVKAMKEALIKVQDENLRNELIHKGYENIKRFSWSSTVEKLICSIEEILTFIEKIPPNPNEPCNTARRLMHYLVKIGGHEPVFSSMQVLYRMYHGELRYDHLLIEKCERNISQMEDRVFNLIEEAISHSEHCDAFIYYWYGLALSKRNLLLDAYHAYLNALRRINWRAGYQWRIAFMAAGCAEQLGMYSHALQLLSSVINQHPTYQEARQQFARIKLKIQGDESIVEIDRRGGESKFSQRSVASPLRGKSSSVESNHVDQPLISVIVSTYNSERFLQGCLEDLESQTIANLIEIIVVNSGSQQNEEKIVHQFQKRYGNIVYLHTKNRESVYAAWNRAIQIAKGRYLTNANVDDRHRQDAFEIMYRTLEDHPEVGVVYADCAVTFKENTTLQKGPIHGRFRWPDFNRELLFQSCFIGPQPMWRKALHEEFGLFDDTFESAGDYEFWLRISHKIKFLHKPLILGLYLLSPKSIEHRNANVSYIEAERARIRHWRSEDGIRPPVGTSYLEMYTKQQLDTSENHYPLVSVVIPTYNRPTQLQNAIKSVLSQTYPNLEVIVVNDAGQDVSWIINHLGKGQKIRYEVHERNMGTGAARNTGLRLAQGKYIAFLDDDDRFYPEHIFSLVAELENNPSLVAAYTDAIQVTQINTKKGNIHSEKKVFYSTDFSDEELLIHNYIPILCLMFRKDALKDVGYFDETLPALEDWEWLIRLSRKGQFNHLPFVTAEYLVKQGSNSRNMLAQTTIREIYQSIYRKCLPYSTPEIRAKQRDFYRTMTGRDLWIDIPEISTVEMDTPKEKAEFVREVLKKDREGAEPRKRAIDTLQSILDAQDIAQAIEEHREDLNDELLDLIVENVEAARADGDEELAEGLEHLLHYIQNTLERSTSARL